jgi:hypothetical protein
MAKTPHSVDFGRQGDQPRLLTKVSGCGVSTRDVAPGDQTVPSKPELVEAITVSGRFDHAEKN